MLTNTYHSTNMTAIGFVTVTNFIEARTSFFNTWVSEFRHWLQVLMGAGSLLVNLQHFKALERLENSDATDEGFEEDDEFDESEMGNEDEDFDGDFYEEEENENDFYEDGEIASEDESDENDTLADDYTDDFEEESLEKTEHESKDKLEEDVYENIDDFVDKDSTFEDENEYFYGDYEE